MNILILSWRGPGHPSAGGAELVTQEHAKAWVRAGHNTTLFTSVFVNAKRRELIEGVEIIRSGKQMFGVQIAAFFWYFLGKHPKYDLVIDQFHGIPFFTPLYVRTRKLAFIHEVAREVWNYNPWPKPMNLLPKIVGKNLEPYVFKLLYRKISFLTVSESTKRDLVYWKIPKENVTVIHNGVSLNLPSKNYNKERKYTAIYFGAISRDKGTEDAIRAFAEIERKDDQWQFWVVGPGTRELTQDLKKLSYELNIGDKVKFWGYVTEKKKFELLAKAHVMINPSLHEGWGLVNIEANVVGLPVVGYDVHGIRDSVKNGETGILVDRGNYRSLAENAMKIVKNSDLYQKFQKNCKKWASKFTWEKATRESLELIESL